MEAVVGVLELLAISAKLSKPSSVVFALRNPHLINFGLSHLIRIMNEHCCSLAFIFMTRYALNSWRKIKVRSFDFYIGHCISFLYFFLLEVDSCVWS